MNAVATQTTFSLHRHSLGHGPTGGNNCPKGSVNLLKVKAAMVTLGLACEVQEYYSPVGYWQELTADSQGLVDIAYYLAVDMFDEAEHFDIEEFRATYVSW